MGQVAGFQRSDGTPHPGTGCSVVATVSHRTMFASGICWSSYSGFPRSMRRNATFFAFFVNSANYCDNCGPEIE